MATKVNLVIDQGSDYIQDFELSRANNTLIDLTGYTGAAQIRKSYTAEIYKSFSVGTSSNGILQITMNSSNTNALVSGQYVWDCELSNISTGVITRVVEGIVTVTPSVTR